MDRATIGMDCENVSGENNKQAGSLCGDPACFRGAVNEARTRDLKLGKLPLYQLSYYRISLLFGVEKRCKDNEIFLPCKIFAAVNVGTDRKLTPVNALGGRCAD